MINDPVDKTLGMLRDDAIQRGLLDLAIVYGWSQMRVRESIMQRQMTDAERYRMCLGKSKPLSNGERQSG